MYVCQLHGVGRCLPHPVSRLEDLLVLGTQLVEKSVGKLHTATPQLPWWRWREDEEGG